MLIGSTTRNIPHRLPPVTKRKQNPLIFTAASPVIDVDDEDDRRQKRLRRFDKIPATTSSIHGLHITIYDEGDAYANVSADYQKVCLPHQL
jgi:hypothetical protein